MKSIKPTASFVVAAILAVWSAASGLAQTNAFSYQGHLTDGGIAANGNYDFRFRLASDPLGNNGYVGTVLTNGVLVANGLFTAALNFGSAIFTGSSFWLEVDARTNGGSGYTALNPLQPLTPTPYAIRASSAGAADIAANVTGTITDAQLSTNVSRLNANQTFGGAVAFNPSSGAPFAVGNSNKVANLNADVLDGLDSSAFWKLGGNSGIADSDFLGTLGSQPLNIVVNNSRALRLEPASFSPNLIGGYSGNAVSNAVGGAVIGGGGSNGATNQINASFSTVSGGAGNGIGARSDYAVIAGGERNTISAFSDRSIISGGSDNLIHTNAFRSAIGGGWGNSIFVGNSFIAWGESNVIQVGSHHAVISGGQLQVIGPNAEGSTIAGGYTDVIQSGADHSTIGGGIFNTVQTNAAYATIPGGRDNVAGGPYSFAAGRRAKANHRGAFVLGDSTDADIASSTNDQFTVRASGGARFISNAGAITGVILPPGGGAWSSLSDRNAKTNFAAVDAREILARLTSVPIKTWNYKGQDAAVRHIGPIAQEFAAAFSVGEDDRHISTVDADGVALAAIQGLSQIVAEQEAQMEAKDRRVESLERRLTELEKLVIVLADKSGGKTRAVVAGGP